MGFHRKTFSIHGLNTYIFFVLRLSRRETISYKSIYAWWVGWKHDQVYVYEGAEQRL